MENSNGGLVRRSMEGGKLAATAMDMVQDRVNKSTRDTEAVVFVQDERSRTVSRKAKGGKGCSVKVCRWGCVVICHQSADRNVT